MKIFFDLLLYVTLFVSILLFAAELKCFPAWVGKIDVTAHKKEKRERYLENRLAILEGRILLTVVLCATMSIISILFSSFPREIENPGFLLFLPLAIWLLGTGLGGVSLGQYFLNSARKSEIYQQTNQLSTVCVRNRFHYGMGLIISFYLSCIVAFTFMHLFFILNLI